MEEVLEAFAVSVQMFSLYLLMCANILAFEAQKANGVLWLSFSTFPPQLLSISRPESFPTSLLTSFLAGSYLLQVGLERF